jgi:dCTP deaminase
MVLSRNEIEVEIAAGRLKFDPPVSSQIGPSSVDLMLGDELLVLPKPGEDEGPIVEPAKPGFQVMPMLRERGRPRLLIDEPYTINSGELILGWTREHITLPTSIAARVEGKSSLARLGLSAHITAPTVMAGYQGTLCLEMYNCGPFRIQLVAGMEIAQLILERVPLPPTEGYKGQFQNPR